VGNYLKSPRSYILLLELKALWHRYNRCSKDKKIKIFGKLLAEKRRLS
jgi:hypothetical protein